VATELAARKFRRVIGFMRSLGRALQRLEKANGMNLQTS
jgi:hypothetical protein